MNRKLLKTVQTIIAAKRSTTAPLLPERQRLLQFSRFCRDHQRTQHTGLT